MNAYKFKRHLLCVECGDKICQRFNVTGVSEDDGDSANFPQLVPDGGGESNRPEHCVQCQKFLENPITNDGVLFILEMVAQDVDLAFEGIPMDPVHRRWIEFYSLDGKPVGSPEDDNNDPERFFGG